jgi:hypothetical protein
VNPELGDRPVIAGAPEFPDVTVKAAPLLATPLTVTTTLPLVAPAGTTAEILVALQLEMELAAAPLNVTVLLPCVDPNPDPEITTGAPVDPELGDTPVIAGAPEDVTVKATPLLATPLTVTTTLPLAAPAGTTAVILVALQLVMEPAVVPLKVTVLLPCADPKLLPVMVTLVPTGPEAGDRVLMAGELAVVIVYVALPTVLFS